MKSRRLRTKILTTVWVTALALCGPSLTGCTAAAYGLGVATMVNDMKVRQREDYESYRRKAEAGKDSDIMTFRQWLRSEESVPE